MESAQVLINQCSNKEMWNIYTTEYYSAIKNEIMSYVGKWMKLEIIILNEINQTEKDKYHMCCFIFKLSSLKMDDGSTKQVSG
jgi:hypothetical protein